MTEYTPKTQLRVLGVTMDDLLDPILDIGCGTGGQFVGWLRQHGREAAGLDRQARAAPGIVKGDWFDFAYGRRFWGTIISHMAFSRSFLHAHIRNDVDARRFANLYMTLLKALKPGGGFIYAPALPFMEAHLPRSRYTVTRRPIEPVSGNRADQNLARLLGDVVLHAVKVEKRQRSLRNR